MSVRLACVKDEKLPLTKRARSENAREVFKVERSREKKGTEEGKLEVDRETALELPRTPFPAVRACARACVHLCVALTAWAAAWQLGLSSCLFTLCFLYISNPAPREQRGLSTGSLLSQAPLGHLALNLKDLTCSWDFLLGPVSHPSK